MSNYENRAWLPKSTQSFENMLDEIGKTPDDVTRYVSTTFSELFDLTGNNNCGEIEAPKEITGVNEPGNRSLDTNSMSTDSICTQCKLVRRLNSIFDYIGTTEIESGSVSETDGLSLFVDQINCETENEDREILPKRSLSDTAIERISDSRFASENSCKRFKSDGFCSSIKLPANSTQGRIEPNFDIGFGTAKKFVINCDIKAFAEAEDPSEIAERNGNDHNAVPHDDVQKNPPTATERLDKPSSEKLANIESSEEELGVTHSITISPRTPNRQEISYSICAASKIERVRTVVERNDDNDSNNASSISKYETLSPSISDSTFSQSTIEEIYYTDATKEICYLNSIERADEPRQDSEGREKSPQEEILGETTIYSNTALQIDERSDNVKKKRIEMNPENSNCTKSSKSGIVANDKAEDLKQQNSNLVDEIGELRSDIVLVENEETSRFLDESFLEVSVDSEKTYDKMNSSVSLNLHERRERSTTKRPVDWTTIDKKNDINAGYSKELNTRDDCGARLLTDGEFEKNKSRDESVNPVDPTGNRPLNFTRITEPRNSSEDAAHISLDSLSESELERIEKEAYTKSKKIYSSTNLNNFNPIERGTFYRPQRLGTESKNDDDLALPNWVTNPAPEPDYKKMRRRNQSRREYIKKLLQEILRLSEIISKVGKTLGKETESGNSDTVAEYIPQIRDPHPVQTVENEVHNRSYNLRASADATETIICRSEESETLRGSDVFFVPQSLSRPKQIEPQNFSDVMIHRPVKLEASVNTVNVIEADHLSVFRKSEKLYGPQSGGSKYVAASIFNRQMDRLNMGESSSSYDNSKASSFYNPLSIFSSLKRDWNGNKTGESSSTIVARNDLKLETRLPEESQLPKKTFQAAIMSETKDKAVSGSIDSRRVNNLRTVTEDTIFYSPGNISSARSEYTRLPSVRNSQIFFSKDSVTKGFECDQKPVEPMSMNFGKNLTVFYSSNK